jgi:hypothetical protein
MKLYAELSAESKIRIQSPLIISPSYQTVTSHSDVEALRKIAKIPKTYELLSTLSAHKMKPNVDRLLTLHKSLTHSHGLSWPSVVYIFAAASICVMAVYHCSRTLISKLKKWLAHRKPRRTDAHNTPGEGAPMSTQEATLASIPTPAHTTSNSSVNTTQPTLYTVHGNTPQSKVVSKFSP